jgi:ATP-dependent Lon protease
MRSHGADLTNAYMDVKPEEKQEIRIEKVSRMLEQRIEVLRLSHEIGQQTKAGIEERQREIPVARAAGYHSPSARRG